MAKRKGTDGSLLSSLPWTLAALTFAVLPHVPYLPPWIVVVYLACAASRWQIERKRGHLPETWIRLFLALCCFIGVILSYGPISGVGPGSAPHFSWVAYHHLTQGNLQGPRWLDHQTRVGG